MASRFRKATEDVRLLAPVAATLWGDGFAEDTLCNLWAARDWSLCAPDEYIMLFPQLVPQAGEFPSALRAHLEGCVTARAWRLGQLDYCAVPVSLRSDLPDRDHGAMLHREWFADDGAVTCLLRRIGLLHTAPERVAAERALLTFLDRLLFDIQAHRVPEWDDASEVLLAFGAGIHPAYLWPQAALSHTRGIAAGWIGHLDRGRRALMPLGVAEYVLDALGNHASSDRQLVMLAGGEAYIDVLCEAAKRRMSGQDTPVRLSPDAASLTRVFSGWIRPTTEAAA